MDAVRQDCLVRKQEYDFFVANRTGWLITCCEFEYPSDADKPRGAVQKSLTIEERYPNRFPSAENPGDIRYFCDAIYLRFDGTFAIGSMEGLGAIGFSPTISALKKLDDASRDEIRKNLSDEARVLFDRGLESYVGEVI